MKKLVWHIMRTPQDIVHQTSKIASFAEEAIS